MAKSKKASYTKTTARSVKTTTTTVGGYAPVSDEVTVYGARKFRTPTHHKQFHGHYGSPQLAAVLDIDGTMQSWGSGLDKDLEKWCAALYKECPDIVFLIVTARDHEYMFETSFNWVMRNFPWAYIGPFCRAKDDPRYASEFKRELCQGFEDMGLYQIIAAADDNKFVLNMWKHWAETHFEDPTEFDLLECDSYADYGMWRSDLPSKGYSTYGSAYSPSKYTSPAAPVGALPKQKWVLGGFVNGVWIPPHWEDIEPDKPVVTVDEAKHRTAGTSRYEEPKDITVDPAWGHYLAERYGLPAKSNKPGTWPRGHLNVVSESPNEAGDSLDGVIDAIEAPTALYRQDLEDMVGHAHPDWTPARIADMTMPQLRKEAGVGDDDYRTALYDQIANVFGSHCCDDELDELDIDEVEDMMEMTREEIEWVLDQSFRMRQSTSGPTKPVISSLDLDNIDPASIGMTDEEFKHRRARMDLEDLVINLRPELTLAKVEKMDAKDLQEIVAKVEADSQAANADEAQQPVVMLDGEVAV